MESIINRVRAKNMETGTFIQREYREFASYVTGVEGSNLEKTLDVMYFGANVVASCATATMSINTAIKAVKGTHVIQNAGGWTIVDGYVRYEFRLSGGVTVWKAGSVVASETFVIIIDAINYALPSEGQSIEGGTE